MRNLSVALAIGLAGICFAPQVNDPAAKRFSILRTAVTDHRSLVDQYNEATNKTEGDALLEKLRQAEEVCYWDAQLAHLAAENEMKEIDEANPKHKFKYLSLYYITIASQTIIDKTLYCSVSANADDANPKPAAYSQWDKANNDLTRSLDVVYDKAVLAYQKCQ